MSREDKSRRAQEILSDPFQKQEICNAMVGVSHRDIELALQDIATRKYKNKSDRELDQLADDQPDKVFPERIGKDRPTFSANMELLLNKDEVLALVNASNEPMPSILSTSGHTTYTTYTAPETNALVNGEYDPTKFKKRGKTR